MTKKSTQRYTWKRNATNGTAEKRDTVTGETLLINGKKFPDDIQAEIFVYGISKISDDRLSQVSASQKFDELKKLVTQFMDGQWKADKTGGSRFLPPIIEVIMEFKGWSVSKAQASYRALDAEGRDALKAGQAKRIAEILEARLAEGVESLDDMR